MKKILYLRKVGCDFGKNEFLKTDLRNHRYFTSEKIMTKKNEFVLFEFVQYSKYVYRYHNKKTGKELKKPVRELINDCCTAVNTYCDGKIIIDNNYCDVTTRVKDIENYVNKNNFDYTKKSILHIVNKFSLTKYDDIIIIE